MKQRIVIGVLALSASALVGLVTHEGYTDHAVIPVEGDRWTIGFGSTTNQAGGPINAGDRTEPVAALQRAMQDVQRFEGAVKACVHVPLHQHEYDAAAQLAYNIGQHAFCNSTVVRRFNTLDYEGACDAFLMWNKVKGRVVQGLVNRRERERRLCLGQL